MLRGAGKPFPHFPAKAFAAPRDTGPNVVDPRMGAPGMSNRHVAIDGPSASGKTVVSRALAARLGTLYLDTGAMYRAVAYLALRNGVELDNDAALSEMFARHSLRITTDESAPSGYRVFVDERDVTPGLTLPDVTSAVSTVASAPNVRAALVERQRAIAAAEPVVMAGRDIGTVVLPDARFKFFLTASLGERAKRRRLELLAGGIDVSGSDVAAQLAERDRLDTGRVTAPLRAAADAVRIDSTDIDVDAVIERMLGEMDRR
jgi:cytidylate kinase